MEEVEYLCEDKLHQDGICLEWEYGPKVVINKAGGVGDCYNISWEAGRCQQDHLEDCIDLGLAHWYGGSTLEPQPWPVAAGTPLPVTPMLSGLGRIGRFQRRYWLSSNGFSIEVPENLPLSVSLGQEAESHLLCLRSSATGVAGQRRDRTDLRLDYAICRSVNIRERHEEHIARRYQDEDAITDAPMDVTPVRDPVWSLGPDAAIITDNASLKEPSKQVMLLQDLLIRCNITGSLLLLQCDTTDLIKEERWVSSLRETAAHVSEVEIKLAVVISPFVEVTPAVAKDLARLLLKDPLQVQSPTLVTWQDKIGGLLNMSSAESLEWLHTTLRKLKHQLSAEYFLLQGDSVSFRSVLDLVDQAQYLTLFTTEVLRTNENIISSYGISAERSGTFYIMSTRCFTWESLSSLIPEALTMSIMGFGVLIPPVVNIGPCSNLSSTESELYVRWLQATVFFPSFHLPIPPHCFDETTVVLSEKLLFLRQEYVPELLEIATNASRNGGALVWPLWWIAPNDPLTFLIDDQYLVGENIMVAPILQAGQTFRDIYLPRGRWTDHQTHRNMTGGQWLIQYRIELDEVAYFSRCSS